MPATPRRKTNSQKTESPAQSLVGCSVAIPPNIFHESESQYTGKVVGTPRRKKNAVYVKVDQDDTEYWFPADEVANWVVQDTKPTATAAVPKTPKPRKHRQHTDSPQGVSTAGSSQPDIAGRQHKQALQSYERPQKSTPVAQRAHDAASCHPENPDAFAETIEDLVKTNNVTDFSEHSTPYQATWVLVACRQPQAQTRSSLLPTLVIALLVSSATSKHAGTCILPDCNLDSHITLLQGPWLHLQLC